MGESYLYREVVELTPSFEKILVVRKHVDMGGNVRIALVPRIAEIWPREMDLNFQGNFETYFVQLKNMI